MLYSQLMILSSAKMKLEYAVVMPCVRETQGTLLYYVLCFINFNNLSDAAMHVC